MGKFSIWIHIIASFCDTEVATSSFVFLFWVCIECFMFSGWLYPILNKTWISYQVKSSFTQLAEAGTCQVTCEIQEPLSYLTSCRLCKGSLDNGLRWKTWYSQLFQLAFMGFKVPHGHHKKLKEFLSCKQFERGEMVLNKLIRCRYKLNHWLVSTDSCLVSIRTSIMCANRAQSSICLVTLRNMEYWMHIWR